jgi:hypothetical protein
MVEFYVIAQCENVLPDPEGVPSRKFCGLLEVPLALSNQKAVCPWPCPRLWRGEVNRYCQVNPAPLGSFNPFKSTNWE